MNPALTIERLVRASPDRVWAAWTTAEGLAGWWWTFLDGTTFEVDARVGGTYRIDSPGAGIGVHGEYLSIDAPREFAATWIWVDDGTDGALEHISVSFDDHPSGTRLTIVHEGPWTTREPMDGYERGWADTLSRLDHVFLADGRSVAENRPAARKT
jgi:uncharacterized protein YndB with AHSA1/START domain